jgi:CubicO group peptidase (beta-lactamase class C family)
VQRLQVAGAGTLDPGLVARPPRGAGERIVPEGRPRYAATPAPAQPQRADRSGYGAQFWLFGPGQGLPEGCYTPAGARGQYAMIVPAHDLIVVRRGFDQVPGFNIARFTRHVMAALGL